MDSNLEGVLNREMTHRRSAPTTMPCPECGFTMRVILVEPAGPDHEKRTFQCETCKHIAAVRVSYR